MKKLFFPLVLGLVLGACSRDDNGSEVQENLNSDNSILLTKIVKKESNGNTETTIFRYDSDGKIVESTSGYEKGWNTKAIYNYTGDLITSTREITTNNASTEENTTEYTYNSDKRLERSVSISNRRDVIYTTTKVYTYNPDGTVSVNKNEDIRYPKRPERDMNRDIKYTYTIENGLITKVVVSDDDFGITTTTYEYDDKNGALKNIKGISALMIETFDEGKLSALKHNIVASTEEVFNKTNGNIVKNISKYEYEYNKNGYPSKVTSTSIRKAEGFKDDILTETFAFEYNK